METIRRNRKSAIIAFLLSLLFHASVILYITLQKTDPFAPVPMPPHEEEKELQRQMQKNEPWVETKARAGNFGAPVFFKDTPSAMEDKPEPEITEENTTQEEQEQPEAPPLNPEHVIESVKEEKIIAAHVQQPEPVTMQQIQRKRQPRERKKEQQPIQQPSSFAKASSFAPPSEDFRKASEDRSEDKQKTTPPSQPSPKKLPSLAQLTQGFLHHLKDEGPYAIHMLGKKNGVPTDEQMKYERYLQKLNWCLQNSFNINHDRCPPSDMEASLQIFLALNKDGTVKHLNLVKSSGNRQLDQFVLFVFKDTSSSFPPVPEYLPHNPFTITYTIMLNTIENNFSIYRR